MTIPTCAKQHFPPLATFTLLRVSDTKSCPPLAGFRAPQNRHQQPLNFQPVPLHDKYTNGHISAAKEPIYVTLTESHTFHQKSGCLYQPPCSLTQEAVGKILAALWADTLSYTCKSINKLLPKLGQCPSHLPGLHADTSQSTSPDLISGNTDKPGGGGLPDCSPPRPLLELVWNSPEVCWIIFHW